LDESQNPALGPQSAPAQKLDSGLEALALVAGFYRISADSAQLAHDLGLGHRSADTNDVLRAAKTLGLKARHVRKQGLPRLATVPIPAILNFKDGQFAILAARHPDGRMRLGLTWLKTFREMKPEELAEIWSGELILIARRLGGPGIDPRTFGFRWFFTSIWRYRKALVHVLLASLFIQAFALITPLFFQIVIDKVLVHKAMSTLVVVAIGLVAIGLFDVVLQYLRTYALSHTTSRIDVELGSRLFHHLLRLPLAYFETRPTGQTVARVRELETIRAFLTGQGLTSAIDLLFTFVFIAVLLAYSTMLTMIVLFSIPIYIAIALIIRPLLLERTKERFNTGAASQQFLVESVVGVHTLKAAAIEPILRNQWEEKLAAYVKVSFKGVMLASLGQNLIQYVSKVTTALVLFFGAIEVINGDLTVGALVAFNMIMNQVTAPILRLSQLWQDFQQTQVSIERLGDILNAAPESPPLAPINLPPARGAIKISNLLFRYTPGGPETVSNIDLEIPAGQVLGIVGPSGSGKSTLAKLVQRFYRPERGQILIDGIDIGQVDIAWLRRQIGVVLQENILFNRTIHENIALAAPGMPRSHVIAVARLAGADEFISKLPLGYDTQIEERGANLSGGQRQRIAIARALATQPRILIFDEATSSLDYESEQIIQTNMRQIVRGRTVIVIAHRLAAVRICDRIITIDGGRLLEDGTHQDLIHRKEGFYGKLWRLQTTTTATTGANA
jgi:subfamily B ATP-binding cassette protein HlyB/CyaB